MMDGYSETEDDDNLEKLTYKVHMDSLGVVNEAPSRLTMHDYRDLGLEGSLSLASQRHFTPGSSAHPEVRDKREDRSLF
ncbi:hypothetical protein N7513_000828 [Penicillium frequentans]|nr:hypothetical protein N7513_000828 [Penicillium glabrum]